MKKLFRSFVFKLLCCVLLLPVLSLSLEAETGKPQAERPPRQNRLLASERTYAWSQAKWLFSGVRHAFLKVKEPRVMQINVLRIDLKNHPEYRFVTADRDPDWGKPMPNYPRLPIRTRRRTVRDSLLDARAKGIDMLLAVNATGWSPWPKPYTNYAGGIRLLISNGVIVSRTGKPAAAFLITKDGEYQIREVPGDEDVSNIQLAVSGFAVILKDGKPTGDKTLHPRTAYGLSKDRQYLYLMTVDGRMKGVSEGVGTLELAQWLKYFGADSGINMDGGGSTTMVVWNPKGNKEQKVRKLNCAKYYRAVASFLGLCRIAK